MYQKLKNLCKERGITVTQLCIQVTGNSGNLATWKKGYMRSDYLGKAADVLNCSTDYMLDRTDNPQGINQINTGDVGDHSNVNVNASKEKNCSEIDGTALELLTAFSELSLGDKAKVMSLIAELSNK